MFFIPYLVFNFHVAGSWWPNTFFAKQAEYAELRNMPIIKRLFDQSLLPAIGVGVTLLPGFFLLLVETLRRKRNVLIAVILWIGGYIFMYAWRLPVTYQHGRYVMPVMPALFILGFVGMAKWIFSENKNKWEWIVKRTWIVSTVVVLGVFWFLGARAYGRDVGFIETEMVATACWMDRNLPKEALVAVHDIGAVGYFGSHKILDLAGLISPDVIPFIRDETRLQDYLDIQEVDYLVTFPDWYPLLTTQATMVFQTDGSIAPALGHENMAVFRWSGR